MELIRRHKLLFIVVIVQLIALPLLLYIVKQNQETRTQAVKSTNLFFTPNTTSSSPLNVDVSSEFSVDIMLDPGVNLASLVKIDIAYDPAVIEPNNIIAIPPNNNTVNHSIDINYDAFPIIVEGPVYSNGRIQVIVSVGNEWARAAQSQTKVATAHFKGIKPTDGSQISFGVNSAVYSVATTDSSSENVLSSSSPAYVNISAPATPIEMSPHKLRHGTLT